MKENTKLKFFAESVRTCLAVPLCVTIIPVTPFTPSTNMPSVARYLIWVERCAC